MPARPLWRGYLKLSLVTCAVELSSATTQAEKISFRIINKNTGNTVKRQYIDSETGKPVKPDNQVKGYKLDSEEYLLVEDDEIEALQIESSHTLDLDGFIDKSTIDQLYLDTPYYLTPADKVSEEAFSVIREALAEKAMAGLAKIVLFRRERPCLLEAFGDGMLLTTLRYDRTVRNADDIFEGIPDKQADEDLVEAAAKMIERKKKKFDPSRLENRNDIALQELIDKRRKEKKAPIAKSTDKPSNVVNLFDALKKSLAQEKGNGDEDEPKGSAKKAKPAASRKKPG